VVRSAGRSWTYAPSYAYGTRRARRYLRREPHNAIACDAMCDVHSGRRDRRRSRALGRHVAARAIEVGVEVHAIERTDERIQRIVEAA
jgi:hypothetical protein